MSEILQETTQWAGDNPTCNHTYLLDNKNNESNIEYYKEDRNLELLNINKVIMRRSSIDLSHILWPIL